VPGKGWCHILTGARQIQPAPTHLSYTRVKKGHREVLGVGLIFEVGYQGDHQCYVKVEAPSVSGIHIGNKFNSLVINSSIK
jgi:hypothetical protein